MSVSVVVKPQGLFSKKLTLQDILTEELAYGITDENYRLKPNESDDVTVIYDPNYIARGFELSFDEKKVCLRLPLPNCSHEIELFYMVTARVCKLMGTKVFERDDELAELSAVERFIQSDIDVSRDILKYWEEQITSGEYKNMFIFGANNPIAVGPQEFKQFGADPDKFGEFLNKKQQLDAYYAVPHIYRKPDGKLFGVYAVCTNVKSIVPIEAGIPAYVNNEIEVSDWYVMLGDVSEKATSVRYEAFIGFIKYAEYYDANHIVVTLSKEDVDELSKLYGTDEV